MVVLDKNTSDELRELYVSSFINTDSLYYQKNIALHKVFSDGSFYQGYLWDCLHDREKISYYKLMTHIKSTNKEIYILWDLQSKERNFDLKRLIYPVESVLKIKSFELDLLLPVLPEDLYIFDNTLKWTLVTTHEEIKPGKRICFYAGDLNNI